MSKNIEKKAEPFYPGKNLRYHTEYFIHNDKVVGERSNWQYKASCDGDYWNDIPSKETFKKLDDLTYLTYSHYNDVKLRADPGTEGRRR
jgi:hypothetical protein